MIDSNYRPGVRISTEVGRARNTFYANSGKRELGGGGGV
jgi:hypothetical protein